ncbi:MAG: hypothetical protein ACRYFU_04445 [Janthinobacterium lividum]
MPASFATCHPPDPDDDLCEICLGLLCDLHDLSSLFTSGDDVEDSPEFDLMWDRIAASVSIITTTRAICLTGLDAKVAALSSYLEVIALPSGTSPETDLARSVVADFAAHHGHA